MADRKRQRELLGYLLGALDESERDAINRQLAADPTLRRMLATTEASLDVLSSVPRVYRPPAGLAARTCRRVFAYSEALANAASKGSRWARPARQRARVMSPAATPPSSVSAWRWSDLITAAAVFLVVSCSVFPALLHNRMNTRLVACQDNLRQIGMSQAQFHELHGPHLASSVAGQPIRDRRLAGARLHGSGSQGRPRDLVAHRLCEPRAGSNVGGINGPEALLASVIKGSPRRSRAKIFCSPMAA